MKHIVFCIAILVFFKTQAQQINPVPDYVFKNQMSVGRNAVTDTAAYFSIGPRYGATKGMMPPMVVDTLTVTGTKRNGLTIFSVQRNKYMYWDSVRVRWSDFAGSSGAYIFASDTSAMLSPYIRHAGNGLTKTGQALAVDTFTIATRNRAQKQVDSLGGIMVNTTTGQNISGNKIFANDITFNAQAITKLLTLPNKDGLNGYSYVRSKSTGVNNRDIYFPNDSGTVVLDKTIGSYISTNISGTTNYIPKFTASSTIGNSQIFDDGTNVGINTTSPATYGGARLAAYQASGSTIIASKTDDATGGAGIYLEGSNSSNNITQIRQFSASTAGTISGINLASGSFMYTSATSAGPLALVQQASQPILFATGGSERMRIKSDGEVLLNTTSDAGAYALQVAGSIYTPNNTHTKYLYLASASATEGYVYGIGNSLIFGQDGASGINIYAGDVNNSITGSRLLLYANDNIRLHTAGTERIRITSAGNIGIGTTSPLSQLEVNATTTRIRVVGTTGGAVNQYVTDGGQMFVGIDNSSASLFGNGAYSRVIYGGNAYPLDFYTNDLIRARITSAGELLINTTTDAGAYALQVAGSIYNTTGAVLAASSGNVGIGTASPSNVLHVNGGSGLAIIRVSEAGTDRGFLGGANGMISGYTNEFAIRGQSGLILSGAGNAVNAYINSSAGELIIANGNTDAGDYKLQVAGAIYNTAAAVLAASGSNDVRIGSTSGRQISGISAGMLQVWDNPGNYGGITIHGQNANNAFGNYVQFVKSRGTGNTVVQNGDDLGGLYFAGADGTNYIRAGAIRAIIDATPGTNDMPTSIVFETTADGATAPTERVRMTSAGNVHIGATSDALTDAGRTLLSVNGSSNSIISMRSGGTLAGFLYANGTSSFDIVSNNIPMRFAMGASVTERMRLQSDGELLIGTTTDAGAYALQVAGSIYNTTGAVLAASSGSVGIGTTSPTDKLTVNGAVRASADGSSVSYYMSSGSAIRSDGMIYIDGGVTNNQGITLRAGTSLTSFTFNQDANFGINVSSFGTSATRTFAILNGTAPSTSPTDAFQLYSADITAGNAAPHFRTENGAVIKLYQETTGVGSATFVAGTGTAVQSGSTFDGYTLQQIVKALRNQGILQ